MCTAYIAVGYACNQKCSFCPCSKKLKQMSHIPLDRMLKTIDEFCQQGITHLVVSGGEPTIYPYFIEMIKYAIEKGLYINVLSNAERLSDKEFIGRLDQLPDHSKITFTTTIHSQNPSEHESINHSPGSFLRSIEGLKNLLDIGINVIVKHCITALNYKELLDFYEYITSVFPESVSIQFCSIDFCGMDESDKESQKIIYPQLKPYFEKMFDKYMADKKNGSERHIYCIYMPFCSCDPFYWQFLTRRSSNYSRYAAPSESENSQLTFKPNEDIGTFSGECQICKVKDICPGTYLSAFEIYGDEIFKRYE